MALADRLRMVLLLPGYARSTRIAAFTTLCHSAISLVAGLLTILLDS